MSVESQEQVEPEVDEVVEDQEAIEGDQPEVAEGEQAAEEAEEFDIVLNGEEEPTPQAGKMPKRVKKLLDRNNALQSDLEGNTATIANNAVEIERLRQELASSRSPVVQPISNSMPMPPTEESTDYDPDKLAVAQNQYQVDLQSWFGNQQKQATDNNAQQAAQAESSKKETEALNAHYDRADSLKVPDYESNEESAVSTMGKHLVKSIALALPNSAMVINYLGKNPAKAQEIATLDKTDPQAGVAKLWELNFNLKAVPRTKSKAPNPETVVEGGGGGSSKLQELYDKATEEGDIKKRRELRTQAKAAGETLQD